jgi:lysophospholipase L1-like esterase
VTAARAIDAEERSARRAPIIFIGLFAAVSAALLALLLAGEILAAVVLVVLLGTAVAVAAFGSRITGRITLIALTGVLIGSLAFLGVGFAQIAAALLADQSGPAAPADSLDLFGAEAKIRASARDTGFRLELSESELNAVLQDALSDGETPFHRVTIDITNQIGDRGKIDFVGEFKSGDLTVEGSLLAEVAGGSIDLEIVDIDVGMFHVPGAGRRAVEEMIESVADLEAAVAEEGADIQKITIGGDRVVITGVNRGDIAVDAEGVLAAYRDSLQAITENGNQEASVAAVPRFPPGRVAGTESPGEPIYLALGDSLAANVGVETADLGYVSRFHSQLEANDQRIYGLVNLGVSGETSGTILSGGQLTAAEAISRDVAYVTIDIGANDLLGHLGSAVCSEDLVANECRERIEATLSAYERNIAEILDRIGDAFPDATVVLLTAYNPFSLGFGDRVTFEAESDAVLTRLNTIAALAARERGFLVADGFTPMQGKTRQTTFVNAAEPDIHPNPLGYDVLTGALVDALQKAKEQPSS